MKFQNKTPSTIKSGVVPVTHVFRDSTLDWSYTDNGQAADIDYLLNNPVYHYQTVTAPFTNWLLNRGRGNTAAAVKFGIGDIQFANINWKGLNISGAAYDTIITDDDESTGFTFNYNWPNVVSGNISSGNFPSIRAFNDHVHQVGNNHILQINGFIVGRTYEVQFIMADNRIIDSDNSNDGVSYEIEVVSGIPNSATSNKYNYRYVQEEKYSVISLRFVASEESIEVKPNIYNSADVRLGTQICAIHILHDIIPTGQYYYVSADGDDDNNGLSRNTPWASLDKVNNFNGGFKPGDYISFRRGDTWTGQLKPPGNGLRGNPITLGAYGDGAHPLIDGVGAIYPSNATETTSEGVIHLQDQSYWIINGFEVTNWSTTQGHRHGILVRSTNNTTTGITIANNDVHDIMGGRIATNKLNSSVTVQGRNTGGIHVYAPLGGFNDIIIENNNIEKIIGVGIFVKGPSEYWDNGKDTWDLDWDKTCKRTLIRGNCVHGSACDNIIYHGTNKPVIEYNHSSFSGLHGDYFSKFSGLWGTRSQGGIQQYNHSHNTLLWAGITDFTPGSPGFNIWEASGLGIGAWQKDQCLLQYNFTHDNYGGSVSNGERLNAASYLPVADDSVVFQGTDQQFLKYNEEGSLLSRYNISIDEPSLTTARQWDNYNNIYYSPSDTFHIRAFNDSLSDTTTPRYLKIENSVIVAKPFIGAEDDGKMGVDAITKSILDNNLWFGTGTKPGNDTTGLYTNPNFINTLPNLIFRDDYVHIYASGTSPNAPLDSRQNERRYFGTIGNSAGDKYNTFGRNNIDLQYRYLNLNTIGSTHEALALNENLAADVVGPLTIRCMSRAVSAEDSLNWLAFLFKNTPYTTSPKVTDNDIDLGILFRFNGEGQSFKKGVGLPNPLDYVNQCGPSEYHIISFVFTNTLGNGSAFNGTGTRVKVYSDTLLIADYGLDQMDSLYFSYNVYGSNWHVRQLHVSSPTPNNFSAIIPNGDYPVGSAPKPGYVDAAYGGGILLSDGRVFCVPLNFPTARIYDPVTNTVSIPNGTYNSSADVSFQYFGGVLLKDGKVFCVPYNSTTGQIYNPVTNNTSSTPPLGSVGEAFVGGVLLNGGKVFCVPHNSTTARIYDPVTNTVTASTGSIQFPGNAAFAGGVLLKDGKVFCVPHNSTTARIYDPVTNTVTASTGSIQFPGNRAFFGGVLLNDGKVFCVPHNSTTARIYDPVTNTVSIPPGTYPGNAAFGGGVLLTKAPFKGQVLCIPSKSKNAYIYNPYAAESSAVIKINLPFEGNQNFLGGVMLNDSGKGSQIFCAPHYDTKALIIDIKPVFDTKGVYDDYLNFIPNIGSPLINRGKHIGKGIKDFVGKGVDGAPNIGAFQDIASLYKYEQVTSFIEIEGRYKISAPTDTAPIYYNYNAIIRDHNFRIINETPQWSIYPNKNGVSINTRSGKIKLESGAPAGRYVIKAQFGNIIKRFPIEVNSTGESFDDDSLIGFLAAENTTATNIVTENKYLIETEQN